MNVQAQGFRLNVTMRVLILLSFLLILVGCGAKSNLVAEQPSADPESQARQMMQRRDYAAAGSEYMRLAGLDKQRAVTYRLQAAGAYIKAGTHAPARSILDDTEIDPKERMQTLRHNILYAYLELEQALPEKALRRLGPMPAPDAPKKLLTLWHELHAEAQAQTGNHAEAIQTRINLARHLPPAQKNDNRQKIWASVKALSLQMLQARRTLADADLAGWYELGIIYKTVLYDARQFSDTIDGWIQRYPGHPAYVAIVPSLTAESQRLGRKPEHIALLLPFSGSYLKASNAIRDGFIAAWYAQPQQRPRISLYDTDALSVVDKYRQAIDDGADFIVGPLEKDAIQTLAQENLSGPNVLALNYIDDDPELSNPGLTQFGLAPEDEAEQVAERAWFDGHALALVITPDGLWGDRMYSAFETRWQQLGGKILEHARFENSAQDYAATAKRILNIDGSEARLKQLQERLSRRLRSSARRRQDADFIFLVAIPAAARQLMPQLQFHRLGTMPVYSTSHIFSGIVDAGKDIDINGIRFVDIPWLLDATDRLSGLRDGVNKNWSADKSNYNRLYALGIDAYRLIPELGRLSSQPSLNLQGQTGELSMTEDGRIRRTLRWAIFVDGNPVPDN